MRHMLSRLVGPPGGCGAPQRARRLVPGGLDQQPGHRLPEFPVDHNPDIGTGVRQFRTRCLRTSRT
jgi:hypothetical protein